MPNPCLQVVVGWLDEFIIRSNCGDVRIANHHFYRDGISGYFQVCYQYTDQSGDWYNIVKVLVDRPTAGI